MIISELMPKSLYLSYLLNKEEKNYVQLKKQTQQQINSLLHSYSNPYIAFSGGKDSTVMLHLISSLKRDIWVRHWDYGRALLPDTIENEILTNLLIIAPYCKIDYEKRPLANSEKARYSHVSKSGFFPRLEKSITKHNWDLCFLGIRKEESSKRRLRTEKYYIEKRKNHDIFFPLRDWSGRDLWTYICEYNLPIPSIYQLLAKLQNNNWNKARLATFFDQELEQLGSFETSNFFLWQNRYLPEWID